MSDDVSLLLRRARRKPLFDAGTFAVTHRADRDGIEALVPHRGSFLLLDDIALDPRDDERAVGRRWLDPGDPVFADHFPAMAIYPGVLLVEALAQLALASRAWHQKRFGDGGGAGVRLLKITEATFLAPAEPGETLTLLSQRIEDNGYTFSALGQAIVGDRILAVAAIEAMEADE